MTMAMATDFDTVLERYCQQSEQLLALAEQADWEAALALFEQREACEQALLAGLPPQGIDALARARLETAMQQTQQVMALFERERDELGTLLHTNHNQDRLNRIYG